MCQKANPGTERFKDQVLKARGEAEAWTRMDLAPEPKLFPPLE